MADWQGFDRTATSTSQMGRFETEWLTSEANLAALTDLSGTWIDLVHVSEPQTTIGDCREFRVRKGMMGEKETPHVPTQGTAHP